MYIKRMESQNQDADQDADQILIKIANSPYYLVQPPLYDWNHIDTQAHINLVSKMFGANDTDNNSDKLKAIEPKLLEPWKYRLASEYNNQYNQDNNIDPYARSFSESFSSSDDDIPELVTVNVNDNA